MLSKGIQVGLPTMAFAENATRAAEFEWEEESGNSTYVREPVGVVAAITPWNYPLYQVSLKVARHWPPVAQVVLKPSEVAPINAFILADIIDEVGLPRACSISSRDSSRRQAKRSWRTRRPTWSRSRDRRAPENA